MQTMKQKGFTLIELLVVIVIIGILATISVATFSGYFAKARDSERQAAVRNMATLLKTARAVDSIISYEPTGVGTPVGPLSTFRTDPNVSTATTTFTALLNDEGGYSVPSATTTAYEYAYVGIETDFAVYICSEEGRGDSGGTSGNIFVDGTTDAVAAVTALEATICPNTGTAIAMTTGVDIDGDSTDDTVLDLNP